MTLFLVTANVGTLFEQLDGLFNSWLNELFKKIDSQKPLFIALHMQEVGGKNYRESMELIDPFLRKFLTYTDKRHYSRYLSVFDTDYTDDVHFTALGNIYFVHESLTNIQLFNFKKNSYTPHLHREIYTGNLYENEYLIKERFDKSFFKNFPWSRKGFVSTKWRINNQEYSFVNIHLFHDPSNIEALNQSPSRFSENRKLALDYTLNRIKLKHHINNTSDNDSNNVSLAIFGDFNFRLDTSSLVKNYSHLPNTIEIKDDSNQVSKLIFRDTDEKETFTVKPKYFECHNGATHLVDELLKFDNEFEPFTSELYEFEKTFPPSYPFSEDLNDGHTYMRSRCPAWCDRIFINKGFKLNLNDTNSSSAIYNIIGKDVCMGDHKPVYLLLNLNDTDQRRPVETVAEELDQNNNNSQANLNAPLPVDILEYNRMSLSFILLNRHLYDINATSLHNHAKFTHFNLLNVKRSNVHTRDGTIVHEQQQQDQEALNRHFLNELNGNLFSFKRYLLEFNLNFNFDRIQYESKGDWRDCLIVMPQSPPPQQQQLTDEQQQNVHISEVFIEDYESHPEDNANANHNSLNKPTEPTTQKPKRSSNTSVTASSLGVVANHNSQRNHMNSRESRFKLCCRTNDMSHSKKHSNRQQQQMESSTTGSQYKLTANQTQNDKVNKNCSIL